MGTFNPAFPVAPGAVPPSPAQQPQQFAPAPAAPQYAPAPALPVGGAPQMAPMAPAGYAPPPPPPAGASQMQQFQPPMPPAAPGAPVAPQAAYPPPPPSAPYPPAPPSPMQMAGQHDVGGGNTGAKETIAPITDFSSLDPNLFNFQGGVDENSSAADVADPVQPNQYYVMALSRIKNPKTTTTTQGQILPGQYKPDDAGHIFGYMQIGIKILAGFDPATRQVNPNIADVNRTFNQLISTKINKFTNTSLAHDLIGAIWGKKNQGWNVLEVLRQIDAAVANEGQPPQVIGFVDWTLQAPGKDDAGNYIKAYKRGSRSFRRDQTTGLYIAEWSFVKEGQLVEARTQAEVVGFFHPNTQRFAKGR